MHHPDASIVPVPTITASATLMGQFIKLVRKPHGAFMSTRKKVCSLDSLGLQVVTENGAKANK